MNATLGWILSASLAGGLLSALLAALTLLVRSAWVSTLVSYAVGALLGAAFLEIIPHAFEHGDPHLAGMSILGGILGFFVLEKLLLWRHCHTENCEAHDGHAAAHDHGRSGVLVIVGDAIHNFLDGVLIAAAFLESTELGLITALAIVAHEIPHEVGNFLILLHSGYSRMRAFAVNLACSGATLVGGLLGYFFLRAVTGWTPALLGVVAASMIYIAIADLVPGLHKRPELRATLAQTSLIALGVATIVLARMLIGEHH